MAVEGMLIPIYFNLCKSVSQDVQCVCCLADSNDSEKATGKRNPDSDEGESDYSSHQPNRSGSTNRDMRGKRGFESDSESSLEVGFTRTRRRQVISDDERIDDDDDDNLPMNSASKGDPFYSEELEITSTVSKNPHMRRHHGFESDSESSLDVGFISDKEDDDDHDSDEQEDDDFDPEGDVSDIENQDKETLSKHVCNTSSPVKRQVLRSMNPKNRSNTESMKYDEDSLYWKSQGKPCEKPMSEYWANLYYHLKALSCLEQGTELKQLLGQWQAFQFCGVDQAR
ncbi:mitotic apparatus protein p62-like [Patiria miniata]|uniref:Uncharacterized protein n=1 Tax=Patiria miniata TaxID=46514 RepID=A0A914AD62_PATMI|nr:mitotic apparatus protein p62-like [Patiria miniata]